VADEDEPQSQGGSPGDELLAALGRGELFLVYQPTIDLHSGAFAGVESLLRWRHPAQGVLTPAQFLDQVDASDVAATIGRWVLSTACSQCVRWYRRGYRFAVSVNVSARHFARRDFVDDVTAALAASRVNPVMMALEFPRRAIVSADRDAAPRLAQLVNLGVKVTVDDVDPGRARLDELKRLGVTTIKLRRSAIENLAGSAAARRRVHDVVESARSHGLRVVASGVEDAAQRELLSAEEVDVGQGFLFSEPREAEEIDHFLEDFALLSGKPL
jgi:EAL domain-containing protein (putative c-di-GMP-specific phosphodiesterase class I)